MSMLGRLKAAAGEVSLASRLGAWRQAISVSVDNLTSLAALISISVDNLTSLVTLISGGGLLPATGTTTGARPLSGYSTALLETGDKVFVQRINETYYFDATSALAADQLDVVNAVGPGRFIRADAVITQADWYVDSVNGDDENPGTAALPLLTQAELTKRWAGKVLWSSIAAATVNLLGTFPTEVLSLNFTLPYGQTLRIRGETSEEVSGTITTYTARNAAADASATVLADISFTGHAGRRIRLTSGANSGAVAYVLFDLGGNTCRVSEFALETGAGASASNGDTFVIETCATRVESVTIAISGGGAVKVYDLGIDPPTLNLPCYITPTFHIAPGSATFEPNTGTFVNCNFSGIMTFVYGGAFYNCAFTEGNFALRGGRYIIKYGGVVDCVSGFSLMGAQLEFNGLFCWDGCNNHHLDIAVGSHVTQNADLQIFRGNQGGIFLISGGSLQQTSATSNRFIYGGNNTFTNAAVNISAACSFVYRNLPTILGSNPGVNDFAVGGTYSGWGDAPKINPANNAMLVEYASAPH